MSFLRYSARIAASAAIVASLGGCISLLPKQKPAQLYRFGYSTPPAQAPPAAPSFTVSQTPTSFDRASAGDLILTVTGDQAAYIAGSRWVTSANTLFDAAVTRAFDAAGGPARLVPHGEPVRADYALKLDVRRFEARYEHGQQAPPTVAVEVYVALVDRTLDTRAAKSRIFAATAPASENRASAIAGAYDEALDKVLNDIVAWVGAKGA